MFKKKTISMTVCKPKEEFGKSASNIHVNLILMLNTPLANRNL
jgi:hypothetical protein